MKKILFALICLMAFFACQNNEKNTEQKDLPLTVKEAKVKTSSPIQKEISTKDENKIVVPMRKILMSKKLNFIINCDNKQKSMLDVEIRGLKNVDYKESYTINAIVEDAQLFDLNNDGYKELYLLLDRTDDSGNKDIMAFASFKDKSAGEIYVIKSKQKMKNHSDNIEFKDGGIYRSYKDHKGVLKSMKYKLNIGESGYQLVLEEVK